MEIRSLSSLVDGQLCDVYAGHYWQQTAWSAQDRCFYPNDKEDGRQTGIPVGDVEQWRPAGVRL
jgi:hypothetical protein